MELYEQELKYRGLQDGKFVEKTETVYFKELSGAERLSITRGQRVKATPGTNKATMEVELGEMMERNQRLVQMTLVTSEGKPVYKRLEDFQRETDAKIKALVKLATEINKDDTEGAAEAGNA